MEGLTGVLEATGLPMHRSTQERSGYFWLGVVLKDLCSTVYTFYTVMKNSLRDRFALTANFTLFFY